MNRKALLEQLEAKNTASKTLFALGEQITPEQMKEANGLVDEMKTIRGQINDLDTFEKSQKDASDLNTYLNGRPAPVVHGTQDTDTEVKKLTIPANVRRVKVKSFSGPDACEKAYGFAQFFLATIGGNKKAQLYCKDHGIALDRIVEKNQLESINSSGGYLVPDVFENDMIVLREKYGVFRPLARRRIMTSDTVSNPRRKSGTTAYFIGEGAAIPASDKQVDRVKLTAKKIGSLTYISSELNEDSSIDMGDDLADEFGYQFALKEDDCGFNGDGSSNYGGIVGACNAFTNLSATIANIAGLKVATGSGYGTSYGSIVLADFNNLMGLLPEYADTPNCGWICHKAFFNGTMQRLEFAGGGNTEQNIAKGNRDKMFLGYPVHVAQKMPQFSAVNQVVCIFGDLSLAVDFGDRRETTIALSTDFAFSQDLIAIRGTERFDINVHDVGNASATASLRAPGPIVALITASS